MVIVPISEKILLLIYLVFVGTGSYPVRNRGLVSSAYSEVCLAAQSIIDYEFSQSSFEGAKD
jgi:hypothetical protein